MQIFVSGLALCLKPGLFLSPGDPSTVDNTVCLFSTFSSHLIPYKYAVIHDSGKGSWFWKGMINLNNPLL